jgi:hypothetical protein
VASSRQARESYCVVLSYSFAGKNSTTSSFSISRDASHSGKKEWTSEFPPMESILKGIKCFLFEIK